MSETSTPSNACAAFWQGIGEAFSSMMESFQSTRAAGSDLGHANGIDGDVADGSTEARQAAGAANDAGGDARAEQTVGTCPLCKVAIVVGHSETSQGAPSATLGMNEWPYNRDIAQRTVAKIAELSEGRVSAQIFYRTTGGGYNAEMRACYAPVGTYLEGVPNNKKIAIELHFNGVGDTSVRRSETLYKGDVSFARRASERMSAIYGNGRARVIDWEDNNRGKASFIYGPTNTYLMEPFFGSNPTSAEIAGTEAAKDALATVYAELLVDWAE